MNIEHIGIALEIMGKDMGGVFVDIIIITAAVMILSCITEDRKDHKDGKE